MSLRGLLGHAAPYRFDLALAGALTTLEAGAGLVIPGLGGQFAGSILSHEPHSVTAILLVLLAVLAVQALIRFANGYVLCRTSAKIIADLQVRLYDHLQSLPLSYYHARQRGNVLALITNDIGRLSDFLTGTLLSVLPLVLTLVGALVLMLRIDAMLALAVAVLVPIFVALLKIVARGLRPISSELQEACATTVAVVEENLAMLPMVKAFTREDLESARHRTQVERVMTLAIAQGRIYAALEPATQLAAALAVVLMLWFANARVSAGAMTPGELVSFLLYAALLTRPISALASVFGHLQMARGALTRLEGALAERPEERSTSQRELGRVRGDIELAEVSFAFPGRPEILRRTSWRINAGEIVALTGDNGAGKSTLVHVLMRLDEIASGTILIDGIDISGVSLASLRRQIGYVPQHALLLNASVRDNILYGNPDAAPAALERAAKAAQAHDFICALPEGYSTVIGDNGIRLSGGQRQRIALARALVKDPPILVLDEATAMFDPEGERSFVVDCREILQGRTVILITHRPASLALADRVMSLHNGRLVAVGGGQSARG